MTTSRHILAAAGLLAVAASASGSVVPSGSSQGHRPGPVPLASSRSEVTFAVDPSAGLDSPWDIPALTIEARLAGRLVLGDGASLRGRVVVDGLETLPGSRVFIAPGTLVISMGENRLDGTFVVEAEDVGAFGPAGIGAVGLGPTSPVPAGTGPSAPPTWGPPLSPLAALGAPPPDCPPQLFVGGASGGQPPSINFVFNQSTIINNQFVQACMGPQPGQMPVPPVVSATGTPSVLVKGGFGGNGVDISVECLGNAVLTINGEICNGPGERGADAEATGLPGDPCMCGGHAEAHGGPGGRAGHLTVTADTIRWGPFGFASVNFGGDGGDAIAHGGPGGDCPECGVDAGRGGDARAYGGAAGPPGRISVVARTKMVPAPGVALAVHLVFGASPDGGDATAFAAPGGDAIECVECPQSGGDGGDAGNATAIGGPGGHGQVIEARSGSAVTATAGADGGDGGSAKAIAQRGGHGGAGASCPCTFPGTAGSGGDGGMGGSALARGGAGGDATQGSVMPTSAGWGGDASADCGLAGGDGGAAGGCVDDVWLGCQVGQPGDPGASGVSQAVGGPAGMPFGGAAPGTPGDPTPEETSTCDPGEPGDLPPFDCVVQATCCVAGVGPGCGDPVCEAAVCGLDPFCCQVLWDGLCARLASTLCPQCAGASNCCAPGAQVGCDDPLCTEIVCSALPSCCEIQWDGGCAELAGAACGVCSGAGL